MTGSGGYTDFGDYPHPYNKIIVIGNVDISRNIKEYIEYNTLFQLCIIKKKCHTNKIQEWTVK